jgi:hypothetical protein
MHFNHLQGSHKSKEGNNGGNIGGQATNIDNVDNTHTVKDIGGKMDSKLAGVTDNRRGGAGEPQTTSRIFSNQ